MCRRIPAGLALKRFWKLLGTVDGDEPLSAETPSSGIETTTKTRTFRRSNQGILNWFAPWRNRYEPYCTACAMATLAGFLFLALYVSPSVPAQAPRPSGDCPPGCAAAQKSEPVGFRDRLESDPVAIFTLLLALGTFWLALVSNKAANAAKNAAEALPIVERAYLFLHGQFSDFRLITGVSSSTVTIAFRNHGKTPAIVTELRLRVWPFDRVPQRTDLASVPITAVPFGMVISAGDANYMRPFNFFLSQAQIDDINNLRIRLYVFGRVLYEDVFGDRWETGFCREYMPEWAPPGSFRIPDSTDLNYRR